MNLRLSDKSRTKLMRDNFTRNQAEIDKLSAQLSSGKKTVKSYDNPTSYSLLMKYKDTQFMNSAYISNAKIFKSDLELKENKLDDLTEKIKEVKQLVLKAGNSANFSQFAETYRGELSTLSRSIVDIGNSKINSQYIFAGTKTDIQPFSATYNGDELTAVTYNGDDASMVMNSDVSGKMSINISGENVFQGRAGMGEDIFDELISLKNDMTGDKLENIDEHLENLETIMNRLINKRGELGSNVQHLELLEEFLGNFDQTLQDKTADIEGVDMADAITSLLSYESVYKASMEVAARMNRMSFLDYMN